MSLPDITLENFNLMYELGRGAFGRVYFAILQNNGKKYAIKAIRKDKILESGMIEGTTLEKNIMFATNH